MERVLAESELFAGMEESQIERLMAISKREHLHQGEYLFLLGDQADRLFIVLEGRMEVCFPLNLGGEIRDVAVETKLPGRALGWSAFVKPYRFTLSARAAEACCLASIPRQELLQMLRQDPVLGEEFIVRLTEVIGRRLLTIQAQWARELQRAVNAGLVGSPALAGV